MDHAFIAVSPERKVPNDGSEPELIRTEHQPGCNYGKPFEGSVPGKAGLKVHKILSINFNIPIVGRRKIW